MIMQTQQRIRRMPRPGRHRGRSTDGIRNIGNDPAIVAAKRAAGALSRLISQPGNKMAS